MQINLRYIFVAVVACAALSCTTTKQTVGPFISSNVPAIKLLGQYVIPFNQNFDSTIIGGLSGIDYDPENDCYYIICDDRSAINPARFYTAKINISENGIDSIQFTRATYLRQPNGKVYPNNLQDASHTPDPEAIRYNPRTRQLVWSSEGERIVKKNDTILEDAAINLISMNGSYEDSFELPSLFKMEYVEKGPRQNGVFEGMTFADNYETLFVNVEEPLYEDGPRADTIENNAFIRILQFDTRSKKNIKQFAYKLDPVAYSPNPPGAFKINGVPDILSIGDGHLLVIERSFSVGRAASTIRLFIADLNKATNVKDHPSLKDGVQFIPAAKKLLLNMDTLGFYIDNIEGVTFGPRLRNGHRTLIFIADNNFDKDEKSQVFLFEILQ